MPSRKTPVRVIFDRRSKLSRQTIIIGRTRIEKSISRFATPFQR